MGKLRTTGKVPGHSRLPGDEPKEHHLMSFFSSAVSMKIGLFSGVALCVTRWGATSEQ